MSESFSDISDMASAIEDQDRNCAIQNHVSRLPRAEYNHYGEKTCLECGNVIPKLRADISTVVRCIECQMIEERGFL